VTAADSALCTDPSRFNGHLDVVQIDVAEDDPSDLIDAARLAAVRR